MLKHKIGMLIAVLLILMTLAPGLASAEDKVIRIGAMYPMTGRAGLYGKDSVSEHRS